MGNSYTPSNPLYLYWVAGNSYSFKLIQRQIMKVTRHTFILDDGTIVMKKSLIEGGRYFWNPLTALDKYIDAMEDTRIKALQEVERCMQRYVDGVILKLKIQKDGELGEDSMHV